MTAPVVVVGVGNPWRGDDGIGWSAIDWLEAHRSPSEDATPGRVRPSVELVRADGEAARLIDCWDGRLLAIVIDAVVTGAPTGNIIEVDPTLLASGSPTAGTHSLGVGHAAALGAALGRVPETLVVLGVEGHDFAEGAPLSAPVAAAVPRVAAAVEALIAEVATCA